MHQEHIACCLRLRALAVNPDLADLPSILLRSCISKHIACAGEHYIVDVNYFPSFKEVETAAEDLAKVIHGAAKATYAA